MRVRPRYSVLAALVATFDSRARGVAVVQEAPAFRDVANAGVLVTVEGRRFLIDAPMRDGIAPYATIPAVERERLESRP